MSGVVPEIEYPSLVQLQELGHISLEHQKFFPLFKLLFPNMRNLVPFGFVQYLLQLVN